MSTSVDTMKNFFNVLKLYANDTTIDGVSVLDHAIRTTTRFAGLQDAVNNFVSDIASVTATAGATQSLLQNCGIVIGADNDYTVDTGAVSGYNAGMGVVKNAQTIVPEDNVILSELSLPAESSTTTHSYTGADGKTFSYTVTYPNKYFEVLDVSTATEVYDGSLDYSTAQTTNLQAGVTYTNASKTYGYLGEEIAPAILNMLRGLDNYWLDEAFKLAYDSFGLDFDGKNINVTFGVNAPYGAETTPTGRIDVETFFPVDSIDLCINSVRRATIDSADINGKDSTRDLKYLDRVIAHEMIHGAMFAAGLFKNSMPLFFIEGVAELVQGQDDYNSNQTENVTELAQDSERLTTALNFQSGADAYPAGCMFLRYLCRQSLPTQISIGTGSTPELFGYMGGEEILSGETSGSQINFGADIFGTTASAAGDDLFVNSTEGTLIVRDARGKILNFANENGIVTARSFLANAAGTIDGNSFGEYEFICGADNADNEIFSGDGGSKLWGGVYGNDSLIGGNGVDEFIAGVGCGSDNIFGANSNDVINLAATSLDQIIGSTVDSNGVALTFGDGSTLTVAGEVNAAFKLSDGSTFVANQSTGQWTQTN